MIICRTRIEGKMIIDEKTPNKQTHVKTVRGSMIVKVLRFGCPKKEAGLANARLSGDFRCCVCRHAIYNIHLVRHMAISTYGLNPPRGQIIKKQTVT